MFDRVSVWLDQQSPNQSVSACAREWADRLHCPLRSFPSSSGPTAGTPLARPEAGELCVLGWSLPKGLRVSLLDHSARAGAAPLVCPDEWHSLSRALVLHEDDSDGSFLRTAARLCSLLQSRAVVLTVARSDREAARRGQRAAEVLGDFDLDCVFDELIGRDAGAAVLHVACWRRCQVVILPARPGRRWWPWRGATLERLTAQPGPLAFLALPAHQPVASAPGTPSPKDLLCG